MNKVLIIDDDKELCALIKRSVLSEDIEADFCNTGKEGLQKLKEKGYIPVLAHPERYSYVQEDPNQVMEFIRAGVFIQSNYGSIVGRYGNCLLYTSPSPRD